MKKGEGSPFEHDGNKIGDVGKRLKDTFSKVLEEVTGNTPSSPVIPFTSEPSPKQEPRENDMPPVDTPEHAHEEHPL